MNVIIDNITIERANYVKYLGVFLDYNKKWAVHIQYIVNKTKYLTFVFSRLAKIMQPKTLFLIYYAFFNSIISHGIIAWGGAFKESSKVLQNLQNKLFKIIFKNEFISKNFPLNVNKLYEHTALSYHYKTLKTSTSNTRNKSLQISKMDKRVSDKNSYISAIKLYNSLPKELKTLNVKDSVIRKKLKK